jgi:hypothetical protein
MVKINAYVLRLVLLATGIIIQGNMLAMMENPQPAPSQRSILKSAVTSFLFIGHEDEETVDEILEDVSLYIKKAVLSLGFNQSATKDKVIAEKK